MCTKAKRPRELPEMRRSGGKFTRLDDDAAQKIYDSDRTNDIEMEIIALASHVACCAEGSDRPRSHMHRRVPQAATNPGSSSSGCGELATHMNKGKW